MFISRKPLSYLVTTLYDQQGGVKRASLSFVVHDRRADVVSDKPINQPINQRSRSRCGIRREMQPTHKRASNGWLAGLACHSSLALALNAPPQERYSTESELQYYLRRTARRDLHSPRRITGVTSASPSPHRHQGGGDSHSVSQICMGTKTKPPVPDHIRPRARDETG